MKPEKLGNPIVATAIVTQLPWSWLFKVGVGCLIVYQVIGSFKKRFKSVREVSGFQPASISIGQARVKANIIHEAMRGFGSGFDVVRQNFANLNYNGWVRLYNAFGNRPDNIPLSDDKNLVEWLQDEFNNDKLNELRVLVPNVF